MENVNEVMETLRDAAELFRKAYDDLDIITMKKNYKTNEVEVHVRYVSFEKVCECFEPYANGRLIEIVEKPEQDYCEYRGRYKGMVLFCLPDDHEREHFVENHPNFASEETLREWIRASLVFLDRYDLGLLKKQIDVMTATKEEEGE